MTKGIIIAVCHYVCVREEMETDRWGYNYARKIIRKLRVQTQGFFDSSPLRKLRCQSDPNLRSESARSIFVKMVILEIEFVAGLKSLNSNWILCAFALCDPLNPIVGIGNRLPQSCLIENTLWCGGRKSCLESLTKS